MPQVKKMKMILIAVGAMICAAAATPIAAAETTVQACVAVKCTESNLTTGNVQTCTGNQNVIVGVNNDVSYCNSGEGNSAAFLA